jgi:predicted nucleotidyltransferase
MLDLSRVDLDELCCALEDHSYEHSWWFDPQSGEIHFHGPDDEATSNELDETGLFFIEPMASHEGYTDMADFVTMVPNRRARENLERAIEGRGAFRRFKDTLLEYPELRQVWFIFHDARMARRAVAWLADHDLISDEMAEQASANYSDPHMGAVGVDPRQVATQVAEDLRALYGPRLVHVALFGSAARGDEDEDSDVDLLVVLDELASPWTELRHMDSVLWRHTERSGLTVSAFPVSRSDFDRGDSPVLIRARREAVPIG